MAIPQRDNHLENWIEKLAQKESSNRCDVVVMDVNNKKSYGVLQFQMATWLRMGRTYNVDTTPENILDCSLQKELAYRMLEDRYDNWRHWTCSVVGCEQWNIIGIGKPPRS